MSTTAKSKNWLLPLEGWIKINTDAWDRDRGSLGAALAKDDKGGTLLAYSTFFEFDDPIVAETATLLEGIRLARDHDFRHVAFEVDCEVVTKAISGHVKYLPWEFQSLTMECKMLLHNFDLREIEWIPREINTGAHNLAI
ncbi:Ribonuclease H-like domain containing protein [Trema orientale]|uniref:Ribonuclease H-like domain containing protein n=1 Tax=Trema orientale TaxID=63057 RepID=A0A2P5EZW1_TREOI|nr:Ribonuclease H-like domain containing protein [Trema orientale]